MTEAVHSKLTAKRPWMFRSSGRLFASLFLVLGLPTVILTALTAYYVSKELSTEAEEHNSVTARLISKHLEEEFFGLRRYVQSFATRRGIVNSLQRNDAVAVQEQVSEMEEQNAKLSRTILTDPGGVLLFDHPYDPSAVGDNFSHRDWFKGAARSDLPYISEVYERAALDKAFVVMIATKIKDSDGNVLGYLGAQYAIRDMMQWLESVRTSKSERIALFDHRGQQVLRVNAAAYKNISDHPEIRQLLNIPQGTRVMDDLDGLGRCIVSHVTSPDIGWTVMAYQDEKAIYAPTKRVMGMIGLFFVIAMSALAGLGWLWYRTLFRYAEDLRRSNQELENFCYSIAHDFRAPLRAMQGFSSMLAEEYGDKLDDNGKDWAQRICVASRRMDRLVSDLLEYGNVGVGSLDLKEVDVEETLQQALTIVAQRIETTGAKIDVQKPLGKVSADEHVLVSVFQQLLSNAIKFVDRNVKPQIRIWSEFHDKKLRIWVQDNGIGIPRNQRERIFGVFQRLHGSDSYSGTGIGLAIVKKGVERMGGKTGVQSEPAKGSAFWVEVPVS